MHIIRKSAAGAHMAKIILDAGHGGEEPGAIFEGRQEKDDNLRLALAVGQRLEENGIDVVYTRVEDVYDTPFEKTQIANREGGDFLISFHRNSSPQADQYSGVETLVYDRSGQKVELAENINEALEQTGFRNLGIQERPGLVILRRSQMPAVLVETGFINTEADNRLFDENFDEIAQAIADAVLMTVDPEMDRRDVMRQEQQEVPMSYAEEWSDESRRDEAEHSYMEDSEEMQEASTSCCRCLYRVQTGAFRRQKYAEDMLHELLSKNYPSYILKEDGYFKVQTGAFRKLDNAVRMEQALRREGYPTFITT